MKTRFPITLNQLSYFVACARTCNMTEAANELHVAQSAVSAAIAQLEAQLKTTLFIRKHAKGLVLTQNGERLLQGAQATFSQLSDTIEFLQDDATQVSGSIDVAMFVTLAPMFIPRILEVLANTHPDLRVNFTEGDQVATATMLRNGQVDLAVGYIFDRTDDLDYEIVGSARPYVIVSEDHELAVRTSVDLDELVDEPYVMLDLPDSRDHFAAMLRSTGTPPVVRNRSSNYESVRAMVASGLGFSILHQRPVFDTTYVGSRAVVLEIAGDVPELSIAVTRLHNTANSARARALIDAVRQVANQGHSDGNSHMSAGS